ncbi:MAG TPA: hypothetical protein VMG82_32170 [Candidatus Sulfotelmatobacter sp.]|nr:hypothetical protein [Candidatus Sulfotelmatobacter sp.]
MNAADLVRALDNAGAVLSVAGGRLRCEVPEPVAHLIPELERQGHEVARILGERLVGNVVRWRRAQCVACSLGSSNPVILRREFFRWSGYRCTLDEFITALANLGFGLDGDGMIAGLILRDDFAAAIQWERRRLAS